MTKPYSEIPMVDVSLFDAAYATGGLPAIMAQAAEQHGPIFRWVSNAVDEAGQTRISMIGPEANRFVMHTHRQQFSHAIGWSPMITDTFGQGLLNMDDPEHAVHRRMWNPAFAASYMGAYLPIMQQVIETRTATWPERGEIDLAAEAREITFDIAAAALSGFATGEQVDNLRNIFYNLMHGFDVSGKSFEEIMEFFMATREKLVSVLVTMIRERRDAPPDERPRDVLSQIVHARDEEGNTLSDEQVLGHLNILLVAGHETTTTLSTWALYLLSTMPEHRERLLNELNASMEGNAEPSIEAIRTLKHMDNFIRETGRMYPPVINVPRGVTEDVEFEGYTIPRGSIVRLGLAATHYLPSVWTDPGTFDPDRLAPPREEDKRTPYSLVTFGGGPRVCIGQHFAMIETKALIAHVLRNYRMEPATSKKPAHAGFFNSFIPGGLPMKVRAL